MLPVCGKEPPPGFGIGTALAVNFEIVAVISADAADATPRAPRATRPSTARQVDALRIRFSPLLMDIRLDPGSSGAIAGPAISRSPAWWPGNIGVNTGGQHIFRAQAPQVRSRHAGGELQQTSPTLITLTLSESVI